MNSQLYEKNARAVNEFLFLYELRAFFRTLFRRSIENASYIRKAFSLYRQLLRRQCLVERTVVLFIDLPPFPRTVRFVLLRIRRADLEFYFLRERILTQNANGVI